jgi:hypothetical protein
VPSLALFASAVFFPSLQAVFFSSAAGHWFFYRVDRIQHYIDRGLIDFQDVKSVFQPYAREIEKHEQVFEEFFDFHEYASAKKFFSQYYSGTHPHVSAQEKSTTRGSAGTAAGA